MVGDWIDTLGDAPSTANDEDLSCFEQESGKPLWKAKIGGTRVDVKTTGSGAMGIRASDGKLYLREGDAILCYALRV
jgi:outer membrane protein assembly factor BamB